MTAASSRAFIEEHGLEEHVAKIAADAPPLTDAQRLMLRNNFLSRNGETPVQQPAPADDTRRSSSHAATETT
jgi:hypothetical protein